MTAAIVAGVIAASATGIAVAAGDPTPEAPPRIAFVANAFNPADALAVGPIAGQLGAPLLTTSPDSLSDGAEVGLVAYAPEAVIVAGGPGAIADSVLDEIRTATGLADQAVGRVFGAGRTETAAELAALFDDLGIDPAFLPVGATATDSDLLDGLDATAFQPAGDYALADQSCAPGEVVTGIAGDGTPTCADDQVGSFDGNADTLDGLDSTDFQPAGDYALADQKCNLGDVATGITAVGDISCSTDQVDGGDAETLDGQDSTDFLASELAPFLPIAVLNVDPDGTVDSADVRAPITGTPTVTHSADSGIYTIDFPGYDAQFFADSFVCTVQDSTDTAIRTAVFSGDIRVTIVDLTGAALDQRFNCAVYDS